MATSTQTTTVTPNYLNNGGAPKESNPDEPPKHFNADGTPSYLNNDGATDVEQMEMLRTSLGKKSAYPMWKVENTYAKNRPTGFAVPMLWKYSDIKGDLLKSGELVPEAQSQRRGIMLVNPAFDPSKLRNYIIIFSLRSWSKRIELTENPRDHSLHDRYRVCRVPADQARRDGTCPSSCCFCNALGDRR